MVGGEWKHLDQEKIAQDSASPTLFVMQTYQAGVAASRGASAHAPTPSGNPLVAVVPQECLPIRQAQRQAVPDRFQEGTLPCLRLVQEISVQKVVRGDSGEAARPCHPYQLALE